MDENIKDSFGRVKNDIDSLRSELNLTIQLLNKNRIKISEICDILNSINQYNLSLNKQLKENSQKIVELSKFKKDFENSTVQHINPTIQQINSTNPIDLSTYNLPFKPQKGELLGLSRGNDGVPTDRQTDNQTDRQVENTHKIPKKADFSLEKESKEQSFDNVINTLASLDSLKKELRLKIKRLTEQEIAVFSLMYQLDDEIGYSDYKLLSERLNLTESSVRDYVRRLIKKEIPVDKTKINNKLIQLNISPILKKVASLSTLLQLRDL